MMCTVQIGQGMTAAFAQLMYAYSCCDVKAHPAAHQAQLAHGMLLLAQLLCAV